MQKRKPKQPHRKWKEAARARFIKRGGFTNGLWRLEERDKARSEINDKLRTPASAQEG